MVQTDLIHLGAVIGGGVDPTFGCFQIDMFLTPTRVFGTFPDTESGYSRYPYITCPSCFLA